MSFACESRQMMPGGRSGGNSSMPGYSIGANATESHAAESDPDFIHKFQVALKEGRECLYWLRLLAYACPDRAERLCALFDECDQIVAILVSSIKTKRVNQQRAREEQRAEKNTLEKRRSGKSRPKEFWFQVPD